MWHCGWIICRGRGADRFSLVIADRHAWAVAAEATLPGTEADPASYVCLGRFGSYLLLYSTTFTLPPPIPYYQPPSSTPGWHSHVPFITCARKFQVYRLLTCDIDRTTLCS